MSSATWLQPPQATLDATRAFKPFLDTLVIAYFTQVFILGMITAKAVTYFSRGSRDPTIVKVCVAFSVLILWCKSGLDIKTIWNSAFFLPYRHLNPALPWSLLTSLSISQIPVALSQVYLCYRLWSISKNHLLSNAIAMAGTLCSTILFIIYVILRVKYPVRRDIKDRAHAWIPPWAFCTCFTDIYLSLASTYYLLQTRKKAVGYQLDYMLLRLASLSITTCLPPALMSAIMAILEIVKSTGEAWAFFTIIIASVYVLCILHSLNSRQEIREEARSRSTMKNPSPLTPGPSRIEAPDAMTAPKPPSHPTETAVQLAGNSFPIESEVHHLLWLQDAQLPKLKDGSQGQRAVNAAGKQFQMQVLKGTEGWIDVE